jgi:hypothetical protein
MSEPLQGYVYKVFDAMKSGISTEQIAKNFELTPKQINKIKKSSEYRQLESIYEKDRYDENRQFLKQQHDEVRFICSEGLRRLRSLIDSEDDKVALEACKWLLNYEKQLQQTETEESLLELEELVSTLLESKQNASQPTENADSEVREPAQEGDSKGKE